MTDFNLKSQGSSWRDKQVRDSVYLTKVKTILHQITIRPLLQIRWTEECCLFVNFSVSEQQATIQCHNYSFLTCKTTTIKSSLCFKCMKNKLQKFSKVLRTTFCYSPCCCCARCSLQDMLQCKQAIYYSSRVLPLPPSPPGRIVVFLRVVVISRALGMGC